jgi:hypothetical protein
MGIMRCLYFFVLTSCTIVLNNCEKYNDTRRWRCYEAALLLKKETEIRTDEEAPLTTPVDASVLRHYRFPVRDRLCFALQRTIWK